MELLKLPEVTADIDDIDVKRELGLLGIKGSTLLPPASSEEIHNLLGQRYDEDIDWRDRSICSQVDPEIFFPERGGSTLEARKICAGCDIREECLQYALRTDQKFGIWGGKSERERRVLRKKAAA